MILEGDCRQTLKTLAAESVSSIVTDPPYEIGFMGKGWDGSGVANDPTLWAECYRVLKPGGHVLAFGAPRTYHRMACAIEDAGFEIRDSIHWVYGSGFPKSLNVSKAIDKAAGLTRDRIPCEGGILSGANNYGGGNSKRSPKGSTKSDDGALTDESQQWSGWGTALKPAHEPIVMARKPLTGTVAANVMEYGTGALNIDGTRVGSEIMVHPAGPQGIPSGQGHYVGTDAQRPHLERKESAGRWPANLVLTHAPTCDLDADCAPPCPVAVLDAQSGNAGALAPASGPTHSGARESRSMAGAFHGVGDRPAVFHNDTGGASRFFATSEWHPEMDAPFLYVAKPSRRERNAGLDGMPEKRPDTRTSAGMGTFDEKGVAVQSNFHPTVKPVALMRYLVRLVTPPGGLVLDPFLGSGTTAVAAILEGFEWIGCELTAEYLPIIEARCQWATENIVIPEPTLFNENTP